MVQNSGDFTGKECQAVMKYLFLRGNLAKRKNYNDMLVTSGGKRPSYSTVNNWVTRLRTAFEH
jgi:hypothetical protein